MLLPAVVLFLLFIVFCAFFSASETAFIASNPYTLEHLAGSGSRRARRVRDVRKRLNELLATILIGNTLFNAAAASVATTIFVALIPNKNQAVLVATLATTVIILFLGEINPKTYAAIYPEKTAFFLIYPVRFFLALFSPIARVFSFLSRLVFPFAGRGEAGLSRSLGEEEVRLLLMSGVRGLSTLRKKMLSGVLDIGSRPIKEIMIPRTEIRAIEADASLDRILEILQASGFSRYPVYKGRMDNVEGVLHARDIMTFVLKQREFDLREILRNPFFVPESASMETVLLQMQGSASHMAFVVDEFGNMEGIVTLEDILEEIVGDIRDEHDGLTEDWLTQAGKNEYVINGSASIKEINQRLALRLPEKHDYTTLAGFFLYEAGSIPQEKESLGFGGHRFTVEKMNKRHISLVRVEVGSEGKDAPA
jgi:putative hemolysin